jgi:small subunit ribosomal protein S5
LINDTPNNRGYSQPKPSPDLLDGLPGEDDSVSHLAQLTHLSPGEIRGLYRFPLIVKRVVTMKSKGKMPSMYSLVVVGNGKGLVGVGEGKDDTANKAVQKAFNQAVRSMDYVERYEDRTVSGTMKSNFGTCKIEMRSRPPGKHTILSSSCTWCRADPREPTLQVLV